MLQFIKSLFYREPESYIGGKENPYLLRWHLIPRNRWFNIYLHKFLRDDDDRALHDHPWWFISIMLRGAYYEITPSEWDGFGQVALRKIGSVAFRRATHSHRVTLVRDKAGQSIPCWTLIFTGPVTREWGFHCPKGWVHWREFLDLNNKGKTGKGCD